jgi:multisubunit Na+/H+ antiporter MnhC subunit
MIDLSFYVFFAIALYAVGIYCLATKRNMIRLILGLEILANAANVLFISFAAYPPFPGFVNPLGHSIVIVSIGISGSISAVALVLVIYAYKHYGTLDIEELRRLRG